MELSIDDLVPLEEAKKDPELYWRTANGVAEYKLYCDYIFVPKKMKDWCEHLGCYKNAPTCQVQPRPSAFPSKMFSKAIELGLGVSPKSRSGLDSEKYSSIFGNLTNGCYDDFLCDSPSMSSTNHAVLGWCCLVLLLVGVFANCFCIPAFNARWNRNAITLYFTGMILGNTLYLGMLAFIFIPHYIPSNFDGQMQAYGTYSAYLIPYGLPIMQLFEITVVWFAVAVLLNIYLINRHGRDMKAKLSRTFTLKCMGVIFVLLFLYTIPKFLEYYITNSNYPNGLVKVKFTTLGQDPIFRNLRTNWLNVPVEYFFPYLAIAILIFLIFEQMVDMFGNQKSECNLSSRKIPLLFASGEILQYCDSNNNLLGVSISLFLLICKVPKFILHIMHTEKYVADEKLRPVTWLPTFLDTLFAGLTPLVFLYVGYLYIFCRDSAENYYKTSKLRRKQNLLSSSQTDVA